MKTWKLILIILVGLPDTAKLLAQDTYHQELIDLLREDYTLSNPSYVFHDTEQENSEASYIYGAATVQNETIAENTFSIKKTYTVSAVGNNAWDSGAGIRSLQEVKQGDVVVVTFWARKLSDDSELTFFAEDGVTFDKEIDIKLSFTQDWSQYFGAFKANKNYAIDGLVIGFHLASQIQTFELGGLTAFNYGDVDLKLAPNTFSPEFYGGYEADAGWRLEAAQRIDSLRKKVLTVQVRDIMGNDIEGASIQIEMLEHEFGFGSAVVGCRFPGNRCTDQLYLEKIVDLDGEGHGFNVAVTENALKWDGWEEEWIGTPEETINAIKWLNDRDVEVRGHTLIWPGWSHLPNDLEMNKSDLPYLRTRIESRLEEMLLHPTLSRLVTEWDVLNEITQVRDLEKAFQVDPNYHSGREIYQEILAQAKSLQPDLKMYINDYVVLSGGGTGTSVINRYKTYLDEIENSEATFDGIGFQCHIGSQPTSILRIKEALDEFATRYQKRIKITEYDVNGAVDAETQGKYMSDFLTMIFSHPYVDAFIMWGFWDGNHWKGNAPIFNLDWSLKPSGQAFIEQVFSQWWTNETDQSDVQGQSSFRPFKGRHKITVTYNGISEIDTINTNLTDTLLFTFGTTTVSEQLPDNYYQISPNPNQNSFSVMRPGDMHSLDLELFGPTGKKILIKSDINSGELISHNLPNGLYLVKIASDAGVQLTKIMVNR